MDDNRHVTSQNGTGFLPDVKSSEIALQTLGKPPTEPITPGNQVKGQTARRRWRRAWYGYCQDTTLHGLKQITEPNSSLFRRYVCVLVKAGIFRALDFRPELCNVCDSYKCKGSITIISMDIN